MEKALRDHRFRQAIMDEVHERPVEIVEGLCRVRRLIAMLPPGAGAAQAAMEHFAEFAAMNGMLPGKGRQRSFAQGDRYVTWEFHSEFVTVTWRAALDDHENWPKDIGLHLLQADEMLGAVRIDITGEREVSADLLSGFALPSLCIAQLMQGSAQVVTDFIVDEAGFVRFEFAAGGLNSLQRSSVLRRLLEVETYRTMALLGLPLARQLGPELRLCEVELSGLVETLDHATSIEAVQSALAALHRLSVRSGQLAEQLGYRFAASRAYGQILRARLLSMGEANTMLGPSLNGFVSNRVDPALATCDAMEKRLVTLSDKLERAIGLLDVRIGLDLQIQNKSLLETIARTGMSQFRLQRTVEGLSVIAISYYLLGILGHLLEGAVEQVPLDKGMVMSLAVLPIIIVVWILVRLVQRRHQHEPRT